MAVRTISLTIICLALLLGPTVTPSTGQELMRRPTAGMFLVATPGMSDPRFSRSVILLVQHSADGAMGLIVNRRSEVPVSEALSELEPKAASQHHLYFGGPVEPGRIIYVHAGSNVTPDIGVIDGVNWGADYERLKKLVVGVEPDSLRVFFGYAGWGPGQLEFELSRDDWRLVPARAEQIFSDEPGNLWNSLNQVKRGLITRRPVTGRYL